MKASDLYGGIGMGQASSQETTNPTPQTVAQKETANAQAQNKPLKNSYGVIAILSLVGILIGAKFALEKR